MVSVGIQRNNNCPYRLRGLDRDPLKVKEADCRRLGSPIYNNAIVVQLGEHPPVTRKVA